MSTLSFIFATPKRVIPNTSPYGEGQLVRSTLWVNEVYLICHDISKKHHMARVNAHTMCGHGVLDLVDDGSSGRFNAQDLSHLHYVV